MEDKNSLDKIIAKIGPLSLSLWLALSLAFSLSLSVSLSLFLCLFLFHYSDLYISVASLMQSSSHKA